MRSHIDFSITEEKRVDKKKLCYSQTYGVCSLKMRQLIFLTLAFLVGIRSDFVAGEYPGKPSFLKSILIFFNKKKNIRKARKSSECGGKTISHRYAIEYH